MLKVAITGSLSSGKSTLGNMFNSLDCAFISLDELIRRNQAKGKIIWEKLYSALGDEYFTVDKELDRKKIFAELPGSPYLKNKIESIVHPEAKRLLVREMSNVKREGKIICAVEVPLLFEAGWEDMFDYIVAAAPDEQVQLQRIVKNKNIDTDTALKWIRIWKDKNDIEKANRILDTGKSKDELRAEISALLKELKR